MKEVSIIIPIYNVEKYVAECINSVISQTYDHSKIECIIVNDCTPDHSMDIVKEVISVYQGDMTFIIHNHEYNQGLSAARNSGIDIATGDYLYFMDSDDYIYPNTIDLLMKVCDDYPQTDIVSGNIYDEFHNYNIFNFNEIRIIDNMNFLYMGDSKLIMALNYLIKRKFINRIEVKFKTGIYFEDFLWNHQISQYASKVVIIPEVTYFYRMNANGIIHQAKTSNLNKSVLDYVLILKSIVRELNKPVYVGKSVNILYLFINTYDIIESNIHLIGNSCHLLRQMKIMRGYLMQTHLDNKRFVLAIMTLMIYSPFKHLKKYGWYRHKFNRIIESFWRLALVLDRFNH